VATRSGANGNQGSKWIRPAKRLAIYLRDGLACAWCGASVEGEARLTLDHLTCRNEGGTHEATNLVTSCLRCNSSRGDRSVEDFAAAVAAYLDHGVTAGQVADHVRQTALRPLDVAAAKDLIARRGSVHAAAQNL
jgi:HNH endonuclease